MERRSAPRYRSDLVTIVDVRCRPHGDASGGCGGEEHASGDAIVLPRAGHFVWQVRGDEVVAEAGRALFFARGDTYRVRHPIPGGDDCTVFAFAPAPLAEAFGAHAPRRRDPSRGPFSAASCTTSPAIALLQQGVRRLLHGTTPAPSNEESGDGLAIDELALHLLELVARAAAPGGAPDRARVAATPARRRRADTKRVHRELAEQARQLLAASFHERWSLAGLARRLHCSPFHLARLFRAEVGAPLHRHLLRLRLRAALERLADGEADLTRLALALGFASHGHLTDSFRREFGVPPARFRDRLTPARLREMSKKLEVAARVAS